MCHSVGGRGIAGGEEPDAAVDVAHACWLCGEATEGGGTKHRRPVTPVLRKKGPVRRARSSSWLEARGHGAKGACPLGPAERGAPSLDQRQSNTTTMHTTVRKAPTAKRNFRNNPSPWRVWQHSMTW